MSLFSWSQQIYGSLSGGYLFSSQIEQPPSYIVNTIHQISYPWYWREENFAFKSAMRADLSFGHMITDNIGYELTGSYLKPQSVSDNSDYGKRILSGDFFQSSLKIVLNIPFKKFDLYSKVGLNLAFGKIKYFQSLDNIPTTSQVGESILIYEYNESVSLGFNAALGINFHLNRRFSIFSELIFVSQTYSPKKGQIVKFFDDTNPVIISGYKPYNSQIEFGKESEWYYFTSADNSVPQKLYKRSYALGGYGLTIGIKFIIWTKKNNEFNVMKDER